MSYTIDYDICPHCGASLLGDVIPDHIEPGGKRYRRSIGVEIRGVYDGVLFSACPDCWGTWHRWSPERNLRLWEKAERIRGEFTQSMKAKDQC